MPGFQKLSLKCFSSSKVLKLNIFHNYVREFKMREKNCGSGDLILDSGTKCLKVKNVSRFSLFCASGIKSFQTFYPLVFREIPCPRTFRVCRRVHPFLDAQYLLLCQSAKIIPRYVETRNAYIKSKLQFAWFIGLKINIFIFYYKA